MLNVMTWVRGKGTEGRGGHYKLVDDAAHEVTLNYLRAQVDNALQVGWKREQIKIYTNFAFEHMGVAAIRHRHVYPKNSFQNKWTAVKQCAIENRPCPNLYFHDLDAFQTEWVDFPKAADGSDLVGMGMATSHNDKFRWNAGVAFMKGECVGGMLRRYFQASDKRRRIVSDEHIWHEVAQTKRMAPFFQVISRNYNVAEGYYWRNELEETGGDIKILHIKPHQMFRNWHWYWEADGSRRTMSWKLTPPRLRELFIKYSLWHPDNDKDFRETPLVVQEDNGGNGDPAFEDKPSKGELG